ncbi:MAG TPA: hypothetical protein VJB08_07090 [Candidatus Nanoarchaeia archaeon]|nr:hypothetical protein [Candidatus Nanoarchaeia archaeon]
MITIVKPSWFIKVFFELSRVSKYLGAFCRGKGAAFFVSFAAKKKHIDKGVVQPGECRYEQRKLEANSAASLISPCKKPDWEVNNFT